ncbi:hypothetical protein IGK26_000676 [Enterococcus sp. DIV1317a]
MAFYLLHNYMDFISLDMSNVILNYIDAQKRKIWDQDLSRKEFL